MTAFSANIVVSKSIMVPSVKLVAIDDTPTSLELLSESLQQEGLTIFTATDP
jgi:CheY-like chemotaxis protein